MYFMFSDFRFCVRQLIAAPGFSAVAILTLGLAIGANTAIFSGVDAVLLHPLPFHDPDSLVTVVEDLPRYSLHNTAPTPQDFVAFSREQACFSGVAGALGATATLTGDGPPEDANALKITAEAFPMLGVVPILGGLFTSDDEQPGRDHVVILSEGLWMRRYGSDRSIIGKTIQVNREPYRVAGVIRPILDFRVSAEMWMPLAFTAAEIQPGTRGPHYIDTIARLKPGIAIERAREEIRAVATHIVEQYPNQASLDPGFTANLISLAVRQSAGLRTPLLILIASVGALMLIACANVSNLLLARAMTRRKEISVRAALGAGRFRIIRQLLTESLLIAILAGVAGTLLALYALHLYAQFGPRGLIHGTQPSLNYWVIAFSLAVSITASVLFGLAPALETSRVDLAEALKEGSRGATAARRMFRESMVAFEIGISLVLLIGAGLLVESFIRLERTSPGFASDNVLTASVSLPATQYRLPAQRATFTRSLLERVRTLPGVRSAAAVDFIPYNGGPGSAAEVVGHPRGPNEPMQIVWQTRASPGYFSTMGIPLRLGRDLQPSDEQGSPPAVVIDETLVKQFFPNLDPVGMQISLPLSGSIYTVVGIVGATKMNNLDSTPRPRAYYFGPQTPFASVSFVLKVEGDPMNLVSTMRREIAALDANLPVSSRTMDQILADSVARQRFSIELMAAFAALAAFLAAIGIYGVLAYLVDQRRREFGIRVALGARPANVLALVLRQGSIAVGAGLTAGLAGAFALTRLLNSLLYEVSATDPLIFVLVSFGLTIIAFLAMTVPAYRASRIDPLEALHHE
jgi:putative ABC transport system permease protein